MKTFREGDWLVTTPIFIGATPLRICPGDHGWREVARKHRAVDTPTDERVMVTNIVERCASCDGCRSKFQPDDMADIEKFKL